MGDIKTKVVKIDPKNIDITLLQEAGRLIRAGKLVAFPTETVYGLGADALNDDAIIKIFKAKGRPFHDPLIVHIASLREAEELIIDLPSIARELGRYFWPGPLTMVMKKSRLVSSMITSGLDTVAIRVPNHPVARGLIRESRRPIVAPSANLFSHTSPTSAKHVVTDLRGKVEMILDSGDTTVGVESTVVDVTELPLKVLRLGGITIEQLEEITSKVVIVQGNKQIKSSPGMLKKHYAPRAKMVLVEEKNDKMIQRILHLASTFSDAGNKVGIIASQENSDKYPGFTVSVLGNATDLETCARNLYSRLRLLDELKCDMIISENFENRGLGRAIMDRLRRASA